MNQKRGGTLDSLNSLQYLYILFPKQISYQENTSPSETVESGETLTCRMLTFLEGRLEKGKETVQMTKKLTPFLSVSA